MNDIPEVVVVVARCCKTKRSFGIRFEKKDAANWTADWAYSVNEQSARREGYVEQKIMGVFTFAPEYPGCPHCGRPSLVQCNCSKLTCWHPGTRNFVCAWCQARGIVTSTAEQIVSACDR